MVPKQMKKKYFINILLLTGVFLIASHYKVPAVYADSGCFDCDLGQYVCNDPYQDPGPIKGIPPDEYNFESIPDGNLSITPIETSSEETQPLLKKAEDKTVTKEAFSPNNLYDSSARFFDSILKIFSK